MIFTDVDGKTFLYFGGIHGGQLQQNVGGIFDPNASRTDLRADDQPALGPQIARLAPSMTELAERPRTVSIRDESGKPLLGGDRERRYFESPWIHRYNGKYYLSYSTGDTHFINYATGDSPYGPFTYRGHLMLPVEGWTTHQSIIEWRGRWWLFYADTQLSGKTHLRNVKVTELHHRPDGSIDLIDPMK